MSVVRATRVSYTDEQVRDVIGTALVAAAYLTSTAGSSR